MTLAGLLSAALGDPALARLRDFARGTSQRGAAIGAEQLDLTAPAASRPFVAAAIAATGDGGAGRPVLAAPGPSREAEDLAAALGDLMDPALVAVFPSWETLPHERLSPRSDTV